MEFEPGTKTPIFDHKIDDFLKTYKFEFSCLILKQFTNVKMLP